MCNTKEILRKELVKYSFIDNEEFKERILEYTTPFHIGEPKGEIENILSKAYRTILDEGLIRTFPIDFAIGRLNYNGGGFASTNTDKTQIYFKIIDGKHDINKINNYIKYVNVLGYFVSQLKILYNNDNDNKYIDYKSLSDVKDFENIKDLWLILEAKFDKVNENEVDFIYHVTETKNLDKIKAQGLVPRSKSKKSYHPERIYVVINIDNLTEIISQFEHNNPNTKYTTLKIDYKLAGKPKLYNDPNYLTFGYYILDNIKPSAIIETIND